MASTGWAPWFALTELVLANENTTVNTTTRAAAFADPGKLLRFCALARRDLFGAMGALAVGVVGHRLREIETEAERLYRSARMDPGEGAAPATLIARLLGAGALRTAPRLV